MLVSGKNETDYIKIYKQHFKKATTEEVEKAYLGCTDVEPQNTDKIILIKEKLTGDMHIYKKI